MLTKVVPNMPAVAADQAEGPLGSRLLELTSDAGTIGYRLVGSEPGTIVRDVAGEAAPSNALLAAAAKIAVGDRDVSAANAARDALADQGVGFVAFRGAATEPLVRRLDATAGMTRLSEHDGLVLWRVLPRGNAVSSSRLRLEDAKGRPLQSVAVTGEHGQTDVALDAATIGRRLVVAEPAGWADVARVTFAGRELTDRKSTRLNSSHLRLSRMPSSA